MRRRTSWVGRSLGLLGIWAWALAAGAQEPVPPEEAPLTQREKDMMVRMKALEERIGQLEQKLDQQPLAPAELGERVGKVEEKLKAVEEEDAKNFDVFWKEGLRLETEDGRFKLRIGGRIHQDWAWFNQDNDLRWVWDPDGQEARHVDLEDGAEFRRARIYLSGEVYDNVEFKAEYDFANGETDFKDVFVALTDLPYLQYIRAGHFKEPFGLEQLTSSNNVTFMERALPDIFTPERNTGVMVRQTYFDQHLWAAAGVFRETDEQGRNADDGYYNFTARVAGTPWYEEDGRKLLYLGAAYTHRNPDGNWRVRQRPESHLSSWRYVDTGTMWVDDEDRFGVESALVYGPFSMQAEYMQSKTDTLFAGERDFSGYYVFASYFLTGENRPYKLAEAAFDAPKPKHNFSVLGDERGPGAWELALRYSSLDLEDSPIFGGEQDDVTVGLTWYLNPNTKMMFNYVKAYVEHALYDGDLDIFQTRVQFMF